MKKTDIAIIKRVLSENKKMPDLNGRIAGTDLLGNEVSYYMNQYVLYESDQAADGIETVDSHYSYKPQSYVDAFDDLRKVDVDIDIEKVKEAKKTFKAGSRPYIVKVEGRNPFYIGVNPKYLYDLLKWTGHDYVTIALDGLNSKKNNYITFIASYGDGRKGYVLPVYIKGTPEPDEVVFLASINR